MNALLSRLILLSLCRATGLWMLPNSPLSLCADSTLRLLTLITLLEGAHTLWEEIPW